MLIYLIKIVETNTNSLCTSIFRRGFIWSSLIISKAKYKIIIDPEIICLSSTEKATWVILQTTIQSLYCSDEKNSKRCNIIMISLSWSTIISNHFLLFTLSTTIFKMQLVSFTNNKNSNQLMQILVQFTILRINCDIV